MSTRPYEISLRQERDGEFVRQEYTVRVLRDTTLKEDAVFFGTRCRGETEEEGIILTHETGRTAYVLPYAFPAVVSKLRGARERSLIYLCDLDKSDPLFSRVRRERRGKTLYIGFSNVGGPVSAGTYRFVQYVRRGKGGEWFTELIGRAAALALRLFAPEPAFYENGLTYRLHSYTDACRGLGRNLLDRRARPAGDEVHTLSPYAFFEITAVSESFAALGALKGLYPYALLSERCEERDFARRELHRLAGAEGPWIEPAHGADAFFHNHRENGVFSDVDGHEEGPNLLSTWKYYDRVLRLAELAELEDDQVLRDAFVRLMPFILSLRAPDGTQPVTYDLDTHLPATGSADGGSGGGQAMWIVLLLKAHRWTGEARYLALAEEAAAKLDALDYDHMYSMRCAPTARGVGWTTKANVLLYELTGKSAYLEHAARISKGLYGYYYLHTSPHTYFSTLGFCYACGRERWESARDICENVWLQLPLLRHRLDEDLLRLIRCFRQNYLWVLPLNGVPLGHPETGYDSVGAEYVPFEFSTGTVGDTTGDWSFQSEYRQVKELYGAAEIFIAQYMFEALGVAVHPRSMLLNLTPQEKQRGDRREFVLYSDRGAEEEVLCFPGLRPGRWTLAADSRTAGEFSAEQLQNGVRIAVRQSMTRVQVFANLSTETTLNGTDFTYRNETSVVRSPAPPFAAAGQSAGAVKATVALPAKAAVAVTLRETVPNVWELRAEGEFSHLRLRWGSRTLVTAERLVVVDNWEEGAESLIVVPVGGSGVAGAPAVLPLAPTDPRITAEVAPEAARGEHCKVVSDGAMVMCYPSQRNLPCALEADFDADPGTDLVLVDVAAVNGGTVRAALLYDGREIAFRETERPGLVGLPAQGAGSYTLRLTADCGFAVGLLRAVDSADRLPRVSIAFCPEDWQRTPRGLAKTFAVDCARTPYLTVVSGRAEGFRILLDGRELTYDIERAVPRAYHRLPFSVWKFPLGELVAGGRGTVRLELEGADTKDAFLAAGPESCNRYPALHTWIS